MWAQQPYPSLQRPFANGSFQEQARHRMRKPEECPDVLDVDPLRIDGLDRRTLSIHEATKEA